MTRRRRLAAQAVLLSMLFAGCKRERLDPAIRVQALKTGVVGLSGLTEDAAGYLWSMGEDATHVVRIDPESFEVLEFPIEGCPPGTELEALAWIGGLRFVFGTETGRSGRADDDLLYGEIDGDRLVITDSSASCDYGRWELTAPDNRGVEGLCFADGVYLVATELIGGDGDSRWAPVGLYDPRTDQWTAHRLRLTSRTGKLAALSCRLEDDVLVALAVERHFGVTRLIEFRIPPVSEGTWIQPRIVVDLAKLIEPLPNFEGIVRQDDGSVILLTDNQYRFVAREPSRLFFIPASALH